MELVLLADDPGTVAGRAGSVLGLERRAPSPVRPLLLKELRRRCSARAGPARGRGPLSGNLQNLVAKGLIQQGTLVEAARSSTSSANTYCMRRKQVIRKSLGAETGTTGSPTGWSTLTGGW